MISLPALAAVQTTELPQGSSPAVLWGAILYFAVVAVIGYMATRRTHTPRDFFVAGSGVGLVALSLSVMSATLSGFAFIGGPGLIYLVGLGALFIILPVAITNPMVAWVLARRLRLLAEVRGVLTLPEAIGVRFRSPWAHGLSATAVLLAVIGYMATNVLALGLVLEAVFGVGLGSGIWIGTGVTLAYAAGGGILAGIWTDVFQGALMALASVLVFLFALDSGGGMAGMSRLILAADEQFLSPWGSLPPMAALSYLFVFGVGALGQPHVIHKFLMIRDPAKLRWYPAVTTLALVMTLLLFFGVGVAVKAAVLRGDMAPLANPDQATPLFLLTYTPELLAALVFAGVAAAIMSTVNSFLNVGAAALIHDLPLAMGRSPANELLWGRIATAAIAVLAALVAQFSGALVIFLGIFGWGLFASALVPALALGLNWGGSTREGAVASIATGLGVTVVFEVGAYLRLYTLPAGVTVSGLALVLSILVFVGVSWATRGGKGARTDPDVQVVLEA
jgi:Na+/proline symporter